jgi:hypothetical protein
MAVISGVATTEVGAEPIAVVTSVEMSGRSNTILASRMQAIADAGALVRSITGIATTEVSAVLTVTSAGAPGGGSGGGGTTTPFVVPPGPFRGDGPSCAFWGEGL